MGKRDFEKFSVLENNTSNSQEYEEILLQVESNKKLVKELLKRGIVKEMYPGNLGKILEFAESIEKRDLFYKDNPEGIYTEAMIEIHLDANYKVIREFAYDERFAQQTRILSRFMYKDFPLNWYDNTNLKIDLTQVSRIKYISELQKIADGSKNWIFVYGNQGRGKSFLAVNKLLNIAKNDETATFAVIDYQSYVSELTNDYYANKDKIDKLVEKLSRVDYLLIRNFGNEENSDIVRNAVTIPLLSSRNSQRKATIITSEFTLEEIEKINSPFNNVVKGKQIRRIIEDNIDQVLELKGAKIY